MTIVAIVQARMGSTRLPDKVMKRINDMPVIELLLKRLAQSKKIDLIVLATSTDTKNATLVAHINALGFETFQGSEQNVLERYYEAAKKYGANTVVRITGDCPLLDPRLIDQVIQRYEDEKADYGSNICPASYPDGLDVEVFSFSALEKAFQLAKRAEEQEHVTPFIRGSEFFKKINFHNNQDYSNQRWTLDEPCDLEVITNVFNYFHPRIDFSFQDVLKLNESEPLFFAANKHLTRNEGSELGTGQKLWKRAKTVIPGGNMLLSKRAEMFLPVQWPAYFSKAKGCQVWDLDGNRYTDMSVMGIGTNILGYGNSEVDEAVRAVVSAGNMSTLNCPEEVYLAERLVELHPWADMVRFARTGGEANAIGIRIARAASGRDKVAVCGYHGWHDWYLAANLKSEANLAGHLLPGLEPTGVPKGLQDTIFTFDYNDFEKLEQIVQQEDIGVIKMEVVRNFGPENNFLQKVRTLATDKNIILMFDECTSGFRQTFGGIHKMYDVTPDMAMFGKALGNGYAITAIIGRQEIMQAAQTSFISSTFWTERIGPSAALKSLDVMERTKSWDYITHMGNHIKQGWRRLSNQYGISISISGIPALASFNFNSSNALAYKTLLTQEMLKKGYLAATSVYTSVAHTAEIIEEYFSALEPIFSLIQECEAGRDVTSLLAGPICHAGFKRLN